MSDRIPEGVEPTPAQWVDRFIAYDRAWQETIAENVLQHGREATMCFIQNHRDNIVRMGTALAVQRDDVTLGRILRRFLLADEPYVALTRGELVLDGHIDLDDHELTLLTSLIPHIERSDDVAAYAALQVPDPDLPGNLMLDTTRCYICAAESNHGTRPGFGRPCPTGITRAAADLIRRARGEQF